MTRFNRIIVVAAAATVTQLGLLNPQANAASFTWDGGGLDDNLSTPANWVGDIAPGTADDVFFIGSTRTGPLVDLPTQYRSVWFLPGAAAFTLGGSNTLTLGASPTSAGTLTNNSTLTQTLNNPLAMFAGAINAASADLVLNGLLNIGAGGGAAGNAITVTGASNVYLNGGISTAIPAGTLALNKTGSGTLFVSGDNSAFAGNVDINGGAIRISNGNALGSTGTITTALTSGGTGLGTLELMGNITVNKNVVTRARQAATANNIMLRNISGNNTITNLFTNTGGNTFNYESLSGTLTITNYNTTLTGGGRILNLSGDGNGQIQNWTAASTASFTVNKSGGGTWVLGSGMSGGTFNTVTSSGGTLVFNGGLGARVFGSATINTGGAIRVVSTDGTSGELGSDPAAAATTITLATGGVLDATTFTTYELQPNQTLVSAGTIRTGTLYRYGDNNIIVGPGAGAVGTMSVEGNLYLDNNYAVSGRGIGYDLGSVGTVGGGVNDLISVNGNLTIDGSSGQIPIFVNPLAGTFAPTYRLLDYTGTLTDVTGGGSNNFAVSSGGGTTRLAFEVSLATANQVNLNVIGTPANLTWSGDGAANVWDLVTTANWNNNTERFYNLDSVNFGSLTSNTTVSLSAAAALVPGPIVVDAGASQNYIFTGGGSLSGGATLTKTGPGRLTIANSGTNTFTGTITISGGTLQVGDGASTAGTLGTGTIVNNAALVLNRSATTTLNNVLAGTGSLEIINGASLGGDSPTFNGDIVITSGSLFPMHDNALGSATGSTIVQQGAQFFTNSARNFASEPIVLNSNATGYTGAIRVGGQASITLGGSITLGATGSVTLQVDGGSALNVNGNITANANQNLYLRGDGTSGGTFNGSINLGTGSLVVLQGVHTLAGANTHSGDTVVQGGTLRIAHPLAVQNSTYDAAGGVTSFMTVNSATFGGLKGSFNIPLQNNEAGAVALTVGSNNQSTTYSGVLSGPGSLTKIGSGTLTLSTMAQTYTGATVIAGGAIKLVPGTPPPSAPVAGSVLWWDASSLGLNNGDPVTSMNDLSGSGNNAVGGFTYDPPGDVAEYTASAPTFATNVINGRSVIRFNSDGTQAMMSQNNLNITGDAARSMFIVLSRGNTASSAANHHMFVFTGAAANNQACNQEASEFNTYPIAHYNNDLAMGVIQPRGQFMLLSGVHVPGVSSGWFNGAAVGTINTNHATFGALNTPAGPVFLADRWGARWGNGDFGELLIYNTALSTTDRQVVEAYLAYKWLGVAPGLENILPTNTVVSITASGATLDLNSVNTRIGSLVGVAGSQVVLGSAVLTTGGDDTSTEFAGNISGAGRLVKQGAGTLTLSGSNSYTGGTSISAGRLVANKLSNGTLTIAAGAGAKITAKGSSNHSSGTTVVPALSIAAGGSLDLTNNAMVIDYTGAVGTLVTDVRQHLQTGRMTNSVGDGSKRHGYVDNAVLGRSTFAGQTVDATSLLLKYTWAGDTNLDGQVDITDLGALATSWQTSGTWINGDLDYSGFIDITDLGMLATNWQMGVGSPIPGGPSLGEALASLGLPSVSVPEPGSVGLAGLCLAGMLARRGPRERRAIAAAKR